MFYDALLQRNEMFTDSNLKRHGCFWRCSVVSEIMGHSVYSFRSRNKISINLPMWSICLLVSPWDALALYILICLTFSDWESTMHQDFISFRSNQVHCLPQAALYIDWLTEGYSTIPQELPSRIHQSIDSIRTMILYKLQMAKYISTSDYLESAMHESYCHWDNPKNALYMIW